jgi:hypothetical protein
VKKQKKDGRKKRLNELRQGKRGEGKTSPFSAAAMAMRRQLVWREWGMWCK